MRILRCSLAVFALLIVGCQTFSFFSSVNERDQVFRMHTFNSLAFLQPSNRYRIATVYFNPHPAESVDWVKEYGVSFDEHGRIIKVETYKDGELRFVDSVSYSDGGATRVYRDQRDSSSLRISYSFEAKAIRYTVSDGKRDTVAVLSEEAPHTWADTSQDEHGQPLRLGTITLSAAGLPINRSGGYVASETGDNRQWLWENGRLNAIITVIKGLPAPKAEFLRNQEGYVVVVRYRDANDIVYAKEKVDYQ